MIICPKCKSNNVKRLDFRQLVNEGTGRHHVEVAETEYRCNMCRKRFRIKTQI